MSASATKKSFTNPLLKKLESEMRKGIQRQGGQVLILKDIQAFIQVIEASYPDSTVNKSQVASALTAGTKKAKELSSRYKSRQKRRYNAVVAKIETILPMSEYIWNKNIFVVASFRSSINAIKTAILNDLVSSGVITNTQSDKLKADIHKGHGVRGTAVSQVEIANSLMAAQNLNINGTSGIKFLTDNLDSFFKVSDTPTNIQEEIQQLTTKYTAIVTKEGKLRADYASIVDFQVGTENIEDSSLEKSIKATFRKFVSEYLTDQIATMKGSGTLEEKIETSIMDAISSNTKTAKVTRRKKVALKSQGKVSSKGTKTKSTASVKAAGTLKRRKSTGKVAKTGFSQAKLYGLLNSRINVTVAKNMEDPALNYQSGVFAGSVKITDVSTTKGGMPSVGYTYQLYPYQTFEPGYAQGDVDRDPRKLIDKSIREIAAQMVMGRLYTRRQ